MLRLGIGELKTAVCNAYETDQNTLSTGRRGVVNEARNVAIYLCRRLSGQTLRTIGKEFGLVNYGSVGSVVSRTKRALRSDARLRRIVERLEDHLRKIQDQT